MAVYLDGDHKRAQIWGEKLGAKGYPTMLILNPEGKELMRLPIGVTVEKYVELMKLSQKKLKSVKEIFEKALSSKSVSTDEWKILAGYSWGQDDKINLKGKKKIAAFKTLYEKVPKTLKNERSQFFFLYLNQLLKVKNIENAKQIHTIAGSFEKALKDIEIAFTNFEDVVYGGVEIVEKIYKGKLKSRKQGVESLLITTAKKLRTHGKLTSEQILLTYYPIIELKKKTGYSKKFKAEFIAAVAKADGQAKDEYSRMDVMSTGIWLLKEAKMLKLAKTYALAEIKKSHAPYYFMSYLSSIEKKLGNKKNALEWKLKAWKAAKGNATKFQWGSSYLLGILDLTPNYNKLFLSKSKEILAELFLTEDAFSGRNNSRLKRLGKKANAWAKTKKKKGILLQLKKYLKENCNKHSQKKVCSKRFKEYQLI